MSFVQAEEAKKHLDSKLIEVEDNFVAQQAILGWIVDNPWIFAFLLQRNVQRRDLPISPLAQKEIIRVREECEKKCADDKKNLDAQIAGLKGQNSIKDGIIAARDGTIIDLNTQIATKDGDIATKDGTIGDLRNQITTNAGLLVTEKAARLSAEQKPVAIWNMLRDVICQMGNAPQLRKVSIDILGIIQAFATDQNAENKVKFLDLLKTYFASGSDQPTSNFANCPAPPGGGDGTVVTFTTIPKKSKDKEKPISEDPIA